MRNFEGKVAYVRCVTVFRHATELVHVVADDGHRLALDAHPSPRFLRLRAARDLDPAVGVGGAAFPERVAFRLGRGGAPAGAVAVAVADGERASNL